MKSHVLSNIMRKMPEYMALSINERINAKSDFENGLPILQMVKSEQMSRIKIVFAVDMPHRNWMQKAGLKVK